MKIKTKIILLFIHLFIVNIIVGQSGYFIESEIEVPNGVGSLKSTLNSSYYLMGKDIKVELHRGNSTQIHYFKGDSVILMDKTLGYDDACGQGTREEMNELMRENDKTVYKDVTIEKTKKTLTILGFECKNAIINYKISTMGFDMKVQNTVWYTDQLTLSENISTGDVSNIGLKNDYVDALKSLGGTILNQESKMNGATFSTITVKKIEKKDNMTSDFIIDKKGCKKMLTLKEHKKQMDKRQTKEMRTSNGFGN
ncbi:MAG: hypothetical protein H0U95_06340 [Bacteroidetes bacterium]|nr:hypothetical protein [Bacteroidota bacterium]